MSRQEIVVTDGSGRTVTVRVTMPTEFVRFLQGHRGDEYWNSRADWQALTYGGLGAQGGEVVAVGGAGEQNATHAFHLQLMAISGGGRSRPLLLLKMWISSNGTLRSGTGTLFHGVNLGLQSGEVTWSTIH